jgi:hypothetical protein
MDSSNVRLNEELADQREPENVVEGVKRAWQMADKFLSETIDPIFKGRSPLVGLPDKYYAKLSTLASFYKQAQARGIPRDEFVNGMLDGSFSPAERTEIFKQLSKDLTLTLNAEAPGLNKDLFASSTIGKLGNQYSTPGRRNMKQLVGYLTSPWTTKEGLGDKARFAAAFTGLVTLAGRGAIPSSVLAAYGLYNAATGQSEEGEKNLQWLDRGMDLPVISIDHQNAFRALTGIDYTNNFGPDFYTGSSPAIEAFQKTIPKMLGTVKNSGDTGSLATGLTMNAVEGLSLFPKLGPFGYDLWKSGIKNTMAANGGTKKVYFLINGSLHSVEVPYGYNDALRDFTFGGVLPQAKEKIDEARLNYARKLDSNYQNNRATMQNRSASEKSAVPSRRADG